MLTQYQSSAHYVSYVASLGSETAREWTTPGAPCGNCHARDALEQRVNGRVGTAHGGRVANLAHGELQYRDPSNGALSSAAYAGRATVAQVYCTTCHAVTDANDPHKTGMPWTPGSFPLYVTSDADAGAALYLEKSATTAAVTGSSAGEYGPSDACMWCHRSRVDITNFISPTRNRITSPYWGPHDGPQADVFTGAGGYTFAGQTYGTSTHQQRLACVDCHMLNVATNAGVADHSFNPQLAACTQCHAAATSFDVNGFESQIRAALTEIETALNSQNLLTRAAAAPYTPLSSSELGDGDWREDRPAPGAALDGGGLTQDQAGALYDYLLVARGGAFGVHNPKYVAELLYDSYFALTGQALATFPRRP